MSQTDKIKNDIKSIIKLEDTYQEELNKNIL